LIAIRVIVYNNNILRAFRTILIRNNYYNLIASRKIFIVEVSFSLYNQFYL